jgi:hypothetical protein
VPTRGLAARLSCRPVSSQFTLSDTVTGATPLSIGVNLGHHHPSDGTWVAFLEHLGVNGALAIRLNVLMYAQGTVRRFLTRPPRAPTAARSRAQLWHGTYRASSRRLLLARDAAVLADERSPVF